DGDGKFVGQAAWLPDQKGLVAVAASQREKISTWRSGGAQIWYVPLADGAPVMITHDWMEYRGISVTADGKSIMTVARDSTGDVWVLPAAGDPRRITTAKLD